ncbi:MAG: hypothetical protein JXC85_00875 [Candidatus Aenigmarchaeota archaeon]|nr:hypothetical protein [Candidatus Aenigmarchaeota archaeon]
MSIFDWLADKPDAAPLKKGEYEKAAAKILRKAGESSRKSDRARTAWLYQMASVLARRAKRWDDSVKYALQSAACSETDGKLFNAGWSYRSAAIASKEKRDYKGAVEYALKASTSFMLSKSGYAAKWCYQLAAKACELDGDAEKAIELHKKACSIEEDDETEHEIERLKYVVMHPTVDQYADKSEVLEYDPVRFEVVVENHSGDVLRDIVVGDKDAKITHEIAELKPGEVKIFSYETIGKLGYMHSPYELVTWKNHKGKELDMELEPASVLARPRIQVNSYVSPDPVVNKESELVVLVKNLSSAPLLDVKIGMDFPEYVQAKRSSPDSFKSIAPGEELGTDFKITPTVLGMQRVARGAVVMQDEKGNEFREELRGISADVLEKPHPERKAYAKKEDYRLEKKHFDTSITAYPISESRYVELSNRYWNQQRGYTLKGTGPDVVVNHVEENCKDMAPVSRHDFAAERMLMYSFKLGEAHDMLTVIVKQDEGFVHLILKLYSDSKEKLVPTLERISKLIRYTIDTETDAKEVEKVEIKKIINIVDSVVQRSKIASGGDEGEVTDKETKIKDSVVQRTDV